MPCLILIYKSRHEGLNKPQLGEEKKHGIVFWIMVRSGQHCSGSEMLNEE